MKRPLRILAVVLGLALLGGAAIAYAQITAATMSFETPFAFRVGGQTYQPGTYSLRISDDQTNFTVGPAKGPEHVSLFVSRLGEPEAMADARLVFDKVGEQYYLSEVWMPGQEGYLVYAAREKHTHVKVKLSKKG